MEVNDEWITEKIRNWYEQSDFLGWQLISIVCLLYVPTDMAVEKS